MTAFDFWLFRISTVLPKLRKRRLSLDLWTGWIDRFFSVLSESVLAETGRKTGHSKKNWPTSDLDVV